MIPNREDALERYQALKIAVFEGETGRSHMSDWAAGVAVAPPTDARYTEHVRQKLCDLLSLADVTECMKAYLEDFFMGYYERGLDWTYVMGTLEIYPEQDRWRFFDPEDRLFCEEEECGPYKKADPELYSQCFTASGVSR